MMPKSIWRTGSARRTGASPAVAGLALAVWFLFATGQSADAQQPSNKEIIGSYTEPAPKPQEVQRSVDFVADLSGRGGQIFSVTAPKLEKGFVVKTGAGLAKSGPAIHPPDQDAAGIASVPDLGPLIEQRAGITASGDAERSSGWIGFAVALTLLGVSATLELRARRRHRLHSQPVA